MFDNKFMSKAIDLAKKSDRDVPIACLIVENGQIIAQACNQKELLNDVSAHAEILAIKKAASLKNNWRLDNCELYVTLEPCPMCATAIINSRISKVYFGAYDNLYGALGSVLDLREVFHSKLEVLGGINEQECSDLLKNCWRKNG